MQTKIYIALLTTVFIKCASPAYGQIFDSTAVVRHLDSLKTIAATFYQEQQLDSAIVYVQQALLIADKYYNKDHLRRAHLIQYLAWLYSYAQRFDEAESNYFEALRIKSIHLGACHVDVGMTRMNIANMYFLKVDYLNAEQYYREAQKILVDTLGEDHLWVGWVWHNLGRVYLHTGRSQSAEEALNRAREIKIKHLGPDDPDVANTLSDLGYVLRQLGKIELGEEYTLKSATIWMDHYGPDHLAFYYAKNNLVSLYLNRGDLTLAKEAAKSAITGKSRFLGENDPDVGHSWNWLGLVLDEAGEYDSAQIAYIEARTIFERAQNQHLPGLSYVLHNLGQNAIHQKLYDTAIGYLQQSLAMKEELFGVENTIYNSTMIVLGEALISAGRYEEAMQNLNTARAFCEKHNLVYNENNRYCIAKLADLHFTLRNPVEARVNLTLLNEINQYFILNLAGFGSERELTLAVNKTSTILEKFLSLNTLFQEAVPTYHEAIFDMILFYKGFVLSESTKLRNLVLQDTTNADVYEAINAYRSLLFQEFLKPEAERRGIMELEQKRDSLEKLLVKSTPDFRGLQRQVRWKEVQDALQPDEAVVEFVHYNYLTPEITDSMFYAAAILRSGDAHPLLVPLFEKEKLARYLDDGDIRREEYVTSIYHLQTSTLGVESLYQLAWRPLDQYLQGVKKIYISPSGLLHQINIDAIVLDDGTILGDKFEIVRIGSSRQLVTEESKDDLNTSAAIFGGVVYDFDTVMVAADSADLTYGPLLMGAPQFTDTEKLTRGTEWNYLHGSAREVDTIAEILAGSGHSTMMYKGLEATEEAFANLSESSDKAGSPRIIHISTHGYFFSDPKATSSTSLSDQQPIFKLSDHPMIRSGLILAGGNYAWKHGHPYKPEMEDGILTAYEISQMDLSDTELVVLSACETGLGDIEGNEGVYGLQRAFKIAGVKNLIMSLWQVPDKATAELMTMFYENWLIKEMTIRQALHAAQKTMRDQGYEHFYWAGFVLVE